MSIEVLNKMTAVPEETPVINVALGNPIYRGPKGDKGDKGDRGDIGPQGPKGDDGFVKFEELTDEQKELLRGPVGPAGENGYTPVKGVDYFTEEDKAEFMKEASSIYYLGIISNNVAISADIAEKLEQIYSNMRNGNYNFIIVADNVNYYYPSFTTGFTQLTLHKVNNDKTCVDEYYTIFFDAETYKMSPASQKWYRTTALYDAKFITTAANISPWGKNSTVSSDIEWFRVYKADKSDLIANNITYDNTITHMDASTAQEAIDHLFNSAIDSVYLENILNEKKYQTEEQVIALIQEYGGGGEPLPPAEGVEF